jgi:hypothetical protein
MRVKDLERKERVVRREREKKREMERETYERI